MTADVANTREPMPGRECAHCRRRCGTVAGGFARIAGLPVCSKPTALNRPDCYRMVMTKFHPLRDCAECSGPQR